MSGTRLYPPSALKLRELRRRGLVPRSGLLVFGSVFLGVGLLTTWVAESAVSQLRTALVRALRISLAENEAGLTNNVGTGFALWGANFGWLWFVASAIVVAVSIAHIGIAGVTSRQSRASSVYRLATHATRLSEAFASAVRSVAVFVVTLVAVALTVYSIDTDAWLVVQDPFALAHVLGVAWIALGIALVVLGLIDLMYVRYSYFQSHRMTQAERDEELRQMRGQGQKVRRSFEPG